MKKRIILFGLCIFIAGVGGLLWIWSQKLREKGIVYIAAVGPVSGVNSENYEEMLRGINLYLDKANRLDLLQGKVIKMFVRDDQNTAQFATKVASEIAAQEEVLLVLGNYADETALVAGNIYEQFGIPAITASARADDITRGNEFYFRIIPNSFFEAEFLVTYIKNILQHDSVCIIYDTDSYGTSLKKNFERKAFFSDMEVIKIWDFDREQGDLEKKLQVIVAELRALKDPGAIFLATHESEGAQIIKSINNPGAAYTIIGSGSFSTPAFIKEFQQYLQEQIQPGYYSDRVYAISPFLKDIAPDEGQAFFREFVNTYHHNPTWIAASYYDAARVAVEAIKLAEIESDAPAFQNRKKIRDALASLSNAVVALQGTTGPIYFNHEGDVYQSLMVGRYTRQKLLPAYSQYQLFRDIEESKEALQTFVQDSSPGRTVFLSGHNMVKEFQVINTGVDLNGISRLDMKRANYTLDFYLWFRFRKEFNVTDIHFPNAVALVPWKTPVLEEITQDAIVRAYHVKGEFSSPFDVQAYPFEQPVLQIMLKHISQPILNLRYVPDVIGMSASLQQKNREKRLIAPHTGWKVVESTSYQSVLRPPSSAGTDPLTGDNLSKTLSQFHTDIRIAREGSSFILKSFFPILVALIILYTMYYVPVEQFAIRFVICLATFLTAGAYQYYVRRFFQFPMDYILTFEYAVITVYGLIGGALMITLFCYIGRKKARFVRFLTMTGKVLHFFASVIVSIFIMSQ